jgi:hypothetical protein
MTRAAPKEEAQQVVDAVKKRGGVAGTKMRIRYGFARENQIDAYRRVSDFPQGPSPPANCGFVEYIGQ